MRRVWGLFVLVVVVAWGIEAARAAPRMSAGDMLSVRWVSQVTLSPDGRQIACVVKRARISANGWTTDLYLVATDGTSPPRRLTGAVGVNTSPAFSPDGKRVAFVSDRGGKKPQIWIIPTDGGEAVQLTRFGTGAEGPVWSPDGLWIAFASEVFVDCPDEACNVGRLQARKKSKVKARVFDHLLYRHWNRWRDGRRSHVFVIPAAGGKPRDLTPGPHDVPPIALSAPPGYAFSPDGKTLAYVKNTDQFVATSTNNDIFEVPVGGGPERKVSTGSGNDNEPRYSPDGRYLAWMSMKGAAYEADRQRILVRDRKTGKVEEWAASFPGQPQHIQWSTDSGSLIFTSPDKGFLEVFAATARGVRQLTNKVYAKSHQVGPSGVIAFAGEAANHPPEVFALGPKDPRPVPLTHFNDELAARLGYQAAEHHWFTGAEGARVHGVLVKPPGFQEGGRYPAVVMIHGGPQGMTGDAFHPRWNLQMFASAGYVVFGINFHGSTGFGQAFTDAIRGDWGGKPYADIMAGTKYLAGLPYVDGKQVCAVGASYGGYMVNWIATQTRRFSCLVSHAGLFNMESNYGATEELWFPEREFLGTPWSNRSLYRKWSPHSYAENIRTPTLVSHSQGDYRVPVAQGFQLFTTLQRLGVASRLLYFPDEDHFIRKPQNIRLFWNTVRGWLGRYLKPGG